MFLLVANRFKISLENANLIGNTAIMRENVTLDRLHKVDFTSPACTGLHDIEAVDYREFIW